MSNRFKAIGSFVYEKGNRIGVTPEEASVDIARKLNAYQMRIERLKADIERLRKAGDAMAFNYEQMHDFDGVYDSDLMKLVDRWNAAKEGKEQP